MRGFGMPVAVMVTGVLIAATAFAISLFGYRRVVEPAGSMEPTFGPGDRLSIREIPGDQVNRGDIVIFTAGAWGDPDFELVKRVVGVGGDTVVCCDARKRITVNDRAITEEYIKDDEGPHPNEEYTVQVEPGHVWVLGDNRGNSRDSRTEMETRAKGAIPVGDIKGVVVRAGGDKIVPTEAFTRAGLPGEPYQNNLNIVVGLLILLGGFIFLASVVWLLVAIRKRGA